MERIICRPMYLTDFYYQKGMKVLILESTGKIIKRSFDNFKVPKEYAHIPLIYLKYDEIDWELAGYKK